MVDRQPRGFFFRTAKKYMDYQLWTMDYRPWTNYGYYSRRTQTKT